MARTSDATITAIKKVGQSLEALRHFLGIFFDPKGRVEHGQRFLTLTEGTSFDAILDAFENHPDGQALLEARPDSESLLADRIDLSRRPQGSFGRSYVEFLLANGFDAADYTVLAKNASASFSADLKWMWLRHRIDATHDARHVLTGYGADKLGEACLLAFRAGQVGHRGAAILAAAAVLGCALDHSPVAILKALAEARRLGRAALLVDLCPFELDLSEPLESCRAKLGLGPPRLYQALMERRSLRKFRKRYPPEFAEP